MDRAPISSNAESGPLPAAWPHSTQLATAFLLGAAVMLLAFQAWQSLPGGARPSDLHPARGQALLDLNRATRAELMQLPGIGPALAERIETHRHTHGKFRTLDDLRAVPGIGPATIERIRPSLVVIDDEDEVSAPVTRLIDSARPSSRKEPPLASPIDIGRASAEELQRLPGIGPVLSRRIIDERQKAPFQSVDDLLRVPGIGPKTLQKLRPLVCVRSEVGLMD